jgi:phosphatidylglycerol:prolipoprotein diacylglycerol transferase
MHQARRKKILLCAALVVVFVVAVFLRQVFRGSLVLSQALTLGPIAIRYYGLCIALAVAAGYSLAYKRMQKFKISERELETLFWYVVPSAFVGARLYHVFSELPYYYRHPLEIFAVWHGGLGIFGAVLGGALGVLFAKRASRKIFHKSFWLYADWLAPSIVVGQIVGRFGNLFNYEAFGSPTTLPWGMFVPAIFRPPTYAQFQFFHPFFLYESLGSCLVLCILFYYERSRQQKTGQLFVFYFLLYNILRFCLEPLRLDSTFVYHSLRLNSITTFVLAVVSAFLLWYISSHEPSTS